MADQIFNIVFSNQKSKIRMLQARIFGLNGLGKGRRVFLFYDHIKHLDDFLEIDPNQSIGVEFLDRTNLKPVGYKIIRQHKVFDYLGRDFLAVHDRELYVDLNSRPLAAV